MFFCLINFCPDWVEKQKSPRIIITRNKTKRKNSCLLKFIREALELCVLNADFWQRQSAIDNVPMLFSQCRRLKADTEHENLDTDARSAFRGGVQVFVTSCKKPKTKCQMLLIIPVMIIIKNIKAKDSHFARGAPVLSRCLHNMNDKSMCNKILKDVPEVLHWLMLN